MFARGRQGETALHVRPSFRRRRFLLALAAVTCVLAGSAIATAAAAPVYVLAPQISGRDQLGERLICSSGTWKGGPTFQYEWVREGVEFQSGPTYTLKAEDVHKELWCIVTATENGEVGKAESENSYCLQGNCHTEPPEAVKLLKAPEVSPSGGATVGQTLTCTQGEWSGRPKPATFNTQWLRDSKAIAGATGSTYQVREEDETHVLSCKVTASNGETEASEVSKNGVEVAGHRPTNMSPPEILGFAAVNETLTCTEGTWSGSKPLKFEFSWVLNGKEVIAHGNSLVVVAADEGQSLSCTVKAENKLGEGLAGSESRKVEGKLAATGAPVISGSAKVGETVKCSEGSWNEPVGQLTLKYQWLRDNITINGATASSYKVESTDAAHLLYCQVTARNGHSEEAHATSEPVAIPGAGTPPKNTGLPTLQGSLSVGATVTCNEGSWTPKPTQYVFQWLRDKVAIESARSSTYQIKVADQGHNLSCKVIAEDSEGASEPAESTGEHVQGESPVLTSPPEVYSASGAPRVGESLTCVRGEWTGAPKPTFTYVWLRDGTKVGSNAAYTVGNEDRGHTLKCEVTATNSEAPGGVKAESSNGVRVPGAAPEPPVGGPSVSGEPSVGSTLTCATGQWEGAPLPIEFKYQWQLDGTPIPSATGPMFIVGSADRGYSLTCRVTGTNSEGTASALSNLVHVIGLEPRAEELPFIAGVGTVGQTLKCERGIWNGKPPPSFSYQWYRDGVTIAGATESSYAIEPIDAGHALSCNVTGANIEGSEEVEARNRVAVPSLIKQATTETHGGGGGGTTTTPSAKVIFATLKFQLGNDFSAVHLHTILKTKSVSLTFIPPAVGTLEVVWYLNVKGAHGKYRQVVLAQAKVTFTSTKKTTVKLKLTAKGVQVLRNRKRMSLRGKATFTIARQLPVAWAEGFVLTH